MTGLLFRVALGVAFGAVLARLGRDDRETWLLFGVSLVAYGLGVLSALA